MQEKSLLFFTVIHITIMSGQRAYKPYRFGKGVLTHGETFWVSYDAFKYLVIQRYLQQSGAARLLSFLLAIQRSHTYRRYHRAWA